MKYWLIFSTAFFLTSCNIFRKDYIQYYTEINQADSIYRIEKDSLLAIKLYKKTFRKFSPKQTQYLDEFETYVRLSDKLNKDFGGEKNLNVLIKLVAPNWKYKKYDTDFIQLYKRNGIDSITIEKKVTLWKKNLNKTLIDSFTIASIRDQEKKRKDVLLRTRNDTKNKNLLLWTFKHYGYPSDQIIGLWSADGIFLLVPTILNHMAASDKYVEFRNQLLQYVRNGDCPPTVFATMVDRYNNLYNCDSEYAFEGTIGLMPKNKIDTIEIDKNRKKIGLPAIKHFQKLQKDYNNK